jgi:vacuolar-type H+-ATPase subunit H
VRCFLIQVGPELQLWQQLTAELVRQAHLDCSERGQLLQAATERQQQLLHQALDMCDTLQQTLLATAAAQQQQQEAMRAAQTEAQALQQDNTRLKVHT